MIILKVVINLNVCKKVIVIKVTSNLIFLINLKVTIIDVKKQGDGFYWPANSVYCTHVLSQVNKYLSCFLTVCQRW